MKCCVIATLKVVKNRMKILQINKFLFPYGGADNYFLNLCKLLERKGHEVIYFCMEHPHNQPSKFASYFPSYVKTQGELSFHEKLKAAQRMFYSFEVRKKLRQLIVDHKPDVAHIHNLHIQLSVSVIDELKKAGMPIVMTLHDHHIVCPINLLFTKGHVCESCIHGRYFNCLFKKCMDNSLPKSAAAMLESYISNVLLKSYYKIDTLISPSKFLIGEVKKMGFSKKIKHLPNFIEVKDFNPVSNQSEKKGMVCFGRLVEEKGISFLLEAVEGLSEPLKIIGEGPERPYLEGKTKKEAMNNVFFLGRMESFRLKEEIAASHFSIVPSICYDNFPYSVLESFALGKPVIGSAIGGIPELVVDEQTGFLFEPKNVKQMREKIEYLLKNPKLCIEMGGRCRRFIESGFTADSTYELLMKEYENLLRK